MMGQGVRQGFLELLLVERDGLGGAIPGGLNCQGGLLKASDIQEGRDAQIETHGCIGKVTKGSQGDRQQRFCPSGDRAHDISAPISSSVAGRTEKRILVITQTRAPQGQRCLGARAGR